MLDNEAVYDICRSHSLLEHPDVPDTMNNEPRHRGQRATMRWTTSPPPRVLLREYSSAGTPPRVLLRENICRRTPAGEHLPRDTCRKTSPHGSLNLPPLPSGKGISFERNTRSTRPCRRRPSSSSSSSSSSWVTADVTVPSHRPTSENLPPPGKRTSFRT